MYAFPSITTGNAILYGVIYTIVQLTTGEITHAMCLLILQLMRKLRATHPHISTKNAHCVPSTDSTLTVVMPINGAARVHK